MVLLIYFTVPIIVYSIAGILNLKYKWITKTTIRETEKFPAILFFTAVWPATIIIILFFIITKFLFKYGIPD